MTGCCGFIGSTMVDRLLLLGHHVIGVDDLSTGQYRFIENAVQYANFEFMKLDLLNLEELKSAFEDGDTVIHFAANADVRFGTDHPGRDL